MKELLDSRYFRLFVLWLIVAIFVTFIAVVLIVGKR